MIILRKLKLKDIPFMLEWMHDEESKHIFQNNFSSMTVDDVQEFVKHSFTDNNQHFAIVEKKNDEYLGTISLKNIDYKNRNAEYAISTRKISRGTGINQEATQLLLKYAFEKLKLNKVYLNVLSSNERAKKFYIKNGFVYEGTAKEHLQIDNKFQDLEWYAILKK